MNVTNAKKFCSNCKTLGYPSEVYESHYLRKDRNDPHSEVLCPIIKNAICNRCGKKGHTQTRCKVSLEKTPAKKAQETKAKIPVTNVFAAFDSASESESDLEPEKVVRVKRMASWADSDSDSD